MLKDMFPQHMYSEAEQITNLGNAINYLTGDEYLKNDLET